MLTYNSLIKPIQTYSSPVWSTNASPSSIAKLQTIQSTALRIATGSVKMSSFQHLHSETLTLPLANQYQLLNTQFLASALRTEHPSHGVVTTDSGPRCMKHTLQSRYSVHLTPYLDDEGLIDPNYYRSTLKEIHTDTVNHSIASLGPSKTLGVIPPSICPSESSLLRPYRTTLSQLRSGYCSRLGSYLQCIGRADDGSCPECGGDEHTSSHIFNCPSHPTELTLSDLWVRPLEAAAFVASLGAFQDLPPLEDHPPPVPPEPPPAAGN